METHEQVLAIVNKVYFRMLWGVVSIAVLVLLYGVCGLLYKEYVQTYDFSPLVPIPVILNDLKSNDCGRQRTAVYQLGRYGKKAEEHLHDLHQVYLLNQNVHDDPILSKNIYLCLVKIMGSEAKATSLRDRWHKEWLIKPK